MMLCRSFFIEWLVDQMGWNKSDLILVLNSELRALAEVYGYHTSTRKFVTDFCCMD
jgi:catalase (peroxidase I)